MVIKYYDNNDDDSPHMYSQQTPMQSNRQDNENPLSNVQKMDYGNSMGKRLPDDNIYIYMCVCVCVYKLRNFTLISSSPDIYI